MKDAKKQGEKKKKGKKQQYLQENRKYQKDISSKDGYNKGQICKDFIEAEEIKKRRQEYIEELFKKRS